MTEPRHIAKQTIRTYGGKRTSVTRDIRDVHELISCRYMLIGKTGINGREVIVATVSRKFWVIIDQ